MRLTWMPKRFVRNKRADWTRFLEVIAPAGQVINVEQTIAPADCWQLSQDFRSGAPGTLAEVYQRYLPDIRRLVCRLCLRPRAPREDIDDLVQEAFARAFSPGAR